MKDNIRKYTAIILLCGASFAVMAHTGFVPLGASGEGFAHNIETGISGFVTADDGSTISHGSLPTVVSNPAAIQEISDILSQGAGPVEIYTLDGRHIRTAEDLNQEIAQLEEGIYIMRRSGVSVKFIKTSH